MKKFLIKILACMLLALTAVSTVSMCMPVSAVGVAPYTYYKENFSFKGTCSFGKNCTGMFMDVKVKATASNNNNETITLQVLVSNTSKTHVYTFYSDGEYHEYKNIFLGFSGGSNVGFALTGANPEITLTVDMIIT